MIERSTETRLLSPWFSPEAADGAVGRAIFRTPADRSAADGVVCRLGDASCAGAHASAIGLSSGIDRSAAQGALLGLQRRYGNQYVGRLLARARDGRDSGADGLEAVERSIDQARGGGHALDAGTRNRMETSFGADFGGVRIHDDARADGLNEALSARAFATGKDVFFRQGEYSPGTSGGRELLAHELTHVVQQTGDGIRAKLTVSQPDDPQELEADRMARAVIEREHAVEPAVMPATAGHVSRMCDECEKDQAGSHPIARSRDDEEHDERESERGAETPVAMKARSADATRGVAIQRTPVPGHNFGTYRYCGFGITTAIPGFIKGMVAEGYDVDYTTGCTFVSFNAWDSVWELYDASNRKLDSNKEAPFGDYTIPADKLNSGVPSDGASSKWSLWYRITDSNPWESDDDDAYPYDYTEFDVYSEPIRDPRTSLTEEVGPVIWQNNFTPAEDGASVDYSVATTATRAVDESQTTSVSATVGGSRDAQIGFSFDGLTGGFSHNLSMSATASISRTHSVNVSTSRNENFTFRQGDLRRGVTYRIMARPLYHRIDGSVQMLSHRDGVISAPGGRVEGGIRVLKGMDFRVEGSGSGTEPEVGAQAWSCKARCNVEGSEPQCQNQRVEGSSSGHPNEETACREAKRDATQKAPRNCYARHCRCFDCTGR